MKGSAQWVSTCECFFVLGPGQSSGSRTSIHPHLISERELSVLVSRAHLIVRSIQLKIGHDLLMQVIIQYMPSTATTFLRQFYIRSL